MLLAGPVGGVAVTVVDPAESRSTPEADAYWEHLKLAKPHLFDGPTFDLERSEVDAEQVLQLRLTPSSYRHVLSAG